jgi:hypothetical protein
VVPVVAPAVLAALAVPAVLTVLLVASNRG